MDVVVRLEKHHQACAVVCTHSYMTQYRTFTPVALSYIPGELYRVT